LGNGPCYIVQWTDFEAPDRAIPGQERTMLGKNAVDEELKRGLGLSMKKIEPFLSAGGDAAEMTFMECCRTCGRPME
jgi:hypothetical protein